jgi:hypothetical protein
MKEAPSLKEGQWVQRGQLIGYCGTSGNSSGPHCHYDIFNKPGNWYIYTNKMSESLVRSIFTDPSPYIKNSLPMENSFPRAGYGFMQWVRSKSGSYWHPGVDCNGVNDLGKPLYSPVEGRVVHVESPIWYKNWLGRLLTHDWGHGFGNFVVIEQSPNFKL